MQNTPHNDNFLNLVEECRPFVKELNVNEVHHKITNNQNVKLIDVREDYEWNQGHLPNAIHISRGVIERDIDRLIPDRNSEIILYCAGGFRSILAAYNIQKMGYTNVISMSGGIKDWTCNQYPVTI